MRVTVFDAKLLTHTDPPVAATAGATASSPGGAIRIGGPTFRPECTIDPRDRPGVLVGDEEGAAGSRQPARLRYRPWMGSPTGRSVPRVETDDVAARAVGEPDASVRDDDPDGKPADVGARDRAGRGIDPQHLARVGRRDPDVPAARGQSERPPAREREAGAAVGASVDASRRSSAAGPNLERPHVVAGLHELIDRAVELAGIGVVR